MEFGSHGKFHQGARLSIEVSSISDENHSSWDLLSNLKCPTIRINLKKISKGANGVEIDVTFGREGDPLFTYHGPPCDCWRHCHQQENFHEYLSYVREIAIDKAEGIGQNLTLLFLDLKLDSLDFKAKARAGQELARSIGLNLFLDSDIMRKAVMAHEPLARNDSSLIDEHLMPTPKRLVRLILSVNHVHDIEVVYNFVHFMEENNATHLMDRIGFDVGMNDDLQQIDSMWRPLKRKLNLWQGDGFTNCISPFYNLGRLSKAVQRREDLEGYPSKVYHWTIDLHDRMRDSLRMGVDAIMTNHPERLLTVLQEPEIAHNYRLSTVADDPFRKISTLVTPRSSELGRHQRSASRQPASSDGGGGGGGFIGGLLDVIASLVAYVREIPFLSLPTTSRFMPKAIREYRISSQQQASAKSSQPEYVVGQSAPNKLSPSSSSEDLVTATSSLDQRISSSSEASAVDKAASVEPTYEGPTWYTSLVSNMIVSFMKIALPAPA